MKTVGRILTVLMFAFLYAPIAVMILFSFNSSKSTFVFSGFSFKWYGEFLSSTQTMSALKNTLLLAVLSAIIATFLGTIASLGIFNLRSKAIKKAVMTTTNIPMMNPDIVTGISLMLLFVFLGRALGFNSSLSFYTLLIAHITFNLPYVILNVLPKLRSCGVQLTEAAEDLGCTYHQAFFRAILPNIAPGIYSGFIMAFTLSLDDFIISYFTDGTGYQTLPLLIYSKIRKSVKPDLYALSTCIFIVILLLLILINNVRAKNEKAENTEKSKKHLFNFSPKFKRITVSSFCLLLCVSIITYVIIPSKPYSYDGEKYNKLFKNLEAKYTTELAGTTLNVFNWGEYISDGTDDSLDVVDAFEKLTGINVNYDNFDSNETMYSKLKSDSVSYDIVIPSDYMIDRMVKENMLKKLDYSKISNFKYIDSDYQHLFYDPKNQYTVPYSYGMVGLIYNSKMVKEPVDSWKIMWDEKYNGKILTFNNSRDAFAIAQSILGQDYNTTNKSNWDKSADLLKKQSPLLQARVMDEVFNKMGGGNAAMAPYYAGDYYTMLETNPDLKFAFPKEGVNIFIDAACVPDSAKNFDAAMMFINFLTEPQVALANAEYICYSSPNTAVRENKDYSFYGDKILYPDKKTMPPVQYFHDIDEDVRTYYEHLWEEVLIS